MTSEGTGGLAWARWETEQLARLPDPVAEAVSGLAAESRRRWILRFRLGRPSPAAEVVRDWLLSEVAGPPRWVVPAMAWDHVVGPRAVLLSYPEAVGQDPLALAYLGWLGAGSGDQRQAVVERLGPLWGLCLYAAERGGGVEATGLESWLSAYRGALWEAGLGAVVRWAEMRAGRAFDFAVRWPEVPTAEAAALRRQLTFGIVPHRPGGEAAPDPVAVLWAWAGLPEAEQAQTAALCTKALEGWHLIGVWRRVAEMPAEEGSEWS
ncbi:MAG: hypothetical protein K6U14_06490 [Firmicutes bacterium]|nr:hypothetical protein [Alicyclobacillaceae bacterium]MCL6497268.1 hypothetical protein [Bacillota bacterium]